MCTNVINEIKSEGFAENLVEIFNNSALALMISIGHRTSLFDFMAELPASTSEEISVKANLNERYVREWLGAMTTGKIVSYDDKTNRYKLPEEHASFLTRKASPNNFAVFAQYISILGSVEDQVINCFKNGGGVPYSEFKRFHEVMAEDSGQSVLPVLIEDIIPLVQGGIEALENGIEVLDVGCGRGRAILLLAERFPHSKFYGYDLSEEAINNAKRIVSEKKLQNIFFEAKDVTKFEIDNKFDLILAFDAIHDQAKPMNVLRGINRVLKDNGTFLMQDIAGSSHVHKNIDHPLGTLLYTISCMHCMTVSLAQNGDGLGAMWGEDTALEYLTGAGFNDVSITHLPHDVQNAYYVATKKSA